MTVDSPIFLSANQTWALMTRVTGADMAKVCVIETLVLEPHHEDVRSQIEGLISKLRVRSAAYLVPHDPRRDRGRDCLTGKEAARLREES